MPQRPRLAARFEAEMAAKGGRVDPEVAMAAADFVRLTLQVAGSAEQLEARREGLSRAVCGRFGLSMVNAELLVRLGEAPEYRPVVDSREIEAFVARFGPGAGQALQQEEAGDIDLSGFSALYGSAEALRLLDTMFALLGADGGVDGSELRRLEEAAMALGIDGVLLSTMHRRHDPRYAGGELSFPLEKPRLRIGSSPGSDIVLSDPQVAPTHAELQLGEGQRVEGRGGEGPKGEWRVIDGESGRPTVLNGRPVQSAPFGPGDELRIGTYVLTLQGGRLKAVGERSFTALSAKKLSRRIGEVSLLDAVSFTVFSGEVIAMVGPSGAGKTTLLNAISGVMRADEGEVSLDGQDFHAILQADRSRMGVVPQDDIVHPELTVEESLYFGGRLRFPRGTGDRELWTEVKRVLDELGIAHIRKSRIGDALRRGISGGQRKRVNLGQELLTRTTRVLFLDEPTSGLDPRAAADIVRLVRQLADRGRIVFLVTHDLSPQVMAQVDHLLVLAPGGRVAFFGPPSDACAYFSVPTPDAIFSRFHERGAAEWGEAYRKSPAYQKFVETREQLLGMELRRTSGVVPTERKPQSRWRQFTSLTGRYATVKMRDRVGLTVLAAQPPFLAAVMAVVFPEPTPSMLFMLSLSCMWFGMSAAVRELISDRVVWARERRVGVTALPYVGSKVVVLAVLAVLQCSFLSQLSWILFGLQDFGFNPVALAAVSSAGGLMGMSLGLLVSALFTSSEAAVGTLPLLLIPQITFSSLMVSLRHMGTLAWVLTWLNPQRYAFDATLKVGERLAQPPRYGGEWTTQDISGPLYELGLKPAAADDFGVTLPLLFLAMAGFSVVFGGGALFRVFTRKLN